MFTKNLLHFIGFNNMPALHRQTLGALVSAAGASSSFIASGLSNSVCATMFDEGCVIVFELQNNFSSRQEASRVDCFRDDLAGFDEFARLL